MEKPLERERNNDEKEHTKLYLKLSYLGSDGENLVKTYVKKLEKQTGNKNQMLYMK